MKHKLKLWLRETYARLLFYTGLHALVNRLMPRRMIVLFGHCVDEPSCNAGLPPDMRIRPEKLTGILDWFARRYQVTTLGGGVDSLAAKDGAERRSVVALTMDDGYADNATALLPLLQQRGLAATVFLEARPLDERRVSWLHKLFWLLDQGRTAEELTRDTLLKTGDAATAEKFRKLIEEGQASLYQFKRVLKYEADEAERDRVLDELFLAAGGDEGALCERVYMGWDQARELRQAGFEVGGHTVGHPILSRLDAERTRAEIAGCAESLRRGLGEEPRVFAYPFGRRWDYGAEAVEAVREAGFSLAVHTHAGTNDAQSDPLQLKRIPIDDQSRMHLLVAEACGGFDLLRRFGPDLSE